MDDEVSQTITYYDPQDFKILSEVSSGASALVYNVCREDTTMFAIKKFRSSSKEAAIVNEVCYLIRYDKAYSISIYDFLFLDFFNWNGKSLPEYNSVLWTY